MGFVVAYDQKYFFVCYLYLSGCVFWGRSTAWKLSLDRKYLESNLNVCLFTVRDLYTFHRWKRNIY